MLDKILLLRSRWASVYWLNQKAKPFTAGTVMMCVVQHLLRPWLREQPSWTSISQSHLIMAKAPHIASTRETPINTQPSMRLAPKCPKPSSEPSATLQGTWNSKRADGWICMEKGGCHIPCYKGQWGLWTRKREWGSIMETHLWNPTSKAVQLLPVFPSHCCRNGTLLFRHCPLTS